MYEKLSKNALKCMYISSIIGMRFVFVILVNLEIFLFIQKDWEIAHVFVIIIAVSEIICMVVSPRFRYNRYRYKIDEECIDIEEGYIFVERSIVPIERLHKLEIDRGPIDRLCGVAKVRVTTAGGDVTIRFLDTEKAEMITDRLKKRINSIVVEQKGLETEDK